MLLDFNYCVLITKREQDTSRQIFFFPQPSIAHTKMHDHPLSRSHQLHQVMQPLTILL